MKRSRLATLAMAIAVTAALTGCGGDDDGGNGGDSSGFADKSAEDIVAEAKEAMGELTALKVTGVTVIEGDRAEYDLQMSQDGRCSGTLALGKLGTIAVRGTTDARYVNFDAKFWKSFLGLEPEPAMDKWVLDERDDFADFCDIEAFIGTVFDDTSKYSSKGTEDVGGEQLVVIEKDHPEEGLSNGYIRVDEPHHLLQLEMMNEQRGTLTLTEFDEDFEVSAPSPDEVITMDELG